VDKIVEEENVEKAEMFQDMFLELGKISIYQIVEEENMDILNDLLRLMGVGMKQPN